jgi:hypothetical protein
MATMLDLIAQWPIVFSGTMRPDRLCAALISEADRLGVTLDRDLWQPAAAIVAHGRYGGTCLDLPPRLQEISGDIVSELFDALNGAAPSGCYLGASEGDGACFVWHLTMEAQAEAINSNLANKWEAKAMEVPEHWLSAIVNGDESSFDYYDDPLDYQAYEAFCRDELSDGWTISAWECESEFAHSHDASPYGVLPCAVTTVLAMRLKPQA